MPSQQSSLSGTRTAMMCQDAMTAMEAASLGPSKNALPSVHSYSVPERLTPRRRIGCPEPLTKWLPTMWIERFTPSPTLPARGRESADRTPTRVRELLDEAAARRGREKKRDVRRKRERRSESGATKARGLRITGSGQALVLQREGEEEFRHARAAHQPDVAVHALARIPALLGMAASGEELDLPDPATDGVLEGADGRQQRDRIVAPLRQKAGVIEEHRFAVLEPHLHRHRFVVDADDADVHLAVLGELRGDLPDKRPAIWIFEVVVVRDLHLRLGPLAVQLEEDRKHGRNFMRRRGDLKRVGRSASFHQPRVIPDVVPHALVKALDRRFPASWNAPVVEDHALAAIGDVAANPVGHRLLFAEPGDEHGAPVMGAQPATKRLE